MVALRDIIKKEFSGCYTRFAESGIKELLNNKQKKDLIRIKVYIDLLNLCYDPFNPDFKDTCT